MGNPKNLFEIAVEADTGETVEKLRDMTIYELRDMVEKKYGRPMEIASYYPLVGRGNILHDRGLSKTALDARVDKALR